MSITKSKTSVDEFIERKVLPEYREIVGEIRRVIREEAPEAKEIISYGIPAYRIKLIIAVISPTKKGITLAFSRGADFEDRYGLLEGVGKKSKNLRMRTKSDVNVAAIRYYLRQAIAMDSR